MDAKSGQGNRRTGGILIGIGILWLLLTACAMNRDTRTQAEKDRDAELWTHALSLPVVIARDQLEDCKSLGVVSERYYEDVPPDPMKRTTKMPWPEHMLRFKTVELGGNAARINPRIDKWKQDDLVLVQSRVLGEALRCHQPTLATR
jgi:hypothetical protein